MKKLILLTALTLAAGCGSSVPPPLEGISDPHKVPQIDYVNRELRDRTAIGDPKLSNQAGILYVTVPIRSTTSESYYIDWRIMFFDAKGQPISGTSWAHHMLNANVTEYLTGNSLAPGAEQFQLDLRYAQ